MPYAKPDDVREALVAEGRDAAGGTAAALSDEALQDAITEATAEVNGRVKGDPYPDPAPPLIAAVTRDIAAYLATLTFRKGNPLPPDHPVRLRYMRAEQLLGEIAKGNVDLPDSPSGPVKSRASVFNPYEGSLWDLETLGIGVDNRALPPWNL
jgi:phage gp36-like protein